MSETDLPIGSPEELADDINLGVKLSDITDERFAEVLKIYDEVVGGKAMYFTLGKPSVRNLHEDIKLWDKQNIGLVLV